MPLKTVTRAGQTVSARFTLVVAVVAAVESFVGTTLGVTGKLEQFMTTSFQIGDWSTNYFGSGTTVTSSLAKLNALQPQHIRVQVGVAAISMLGNSGQASDWGFSSLDKSLLLFLEVVDLSPELQVANAPSWMCLGNGDLDVTNILATMRSFQPTLCAIAN